MRILERNISTEFMREFFGKMHTKLRTLRGRNFWHSSFPSFSILSVNVSIYLKSIVTYSWAQSRFLTTENAISILTRASEHTEKMKRIALERIPSVIRMNRNLIFISRYTVTRINFSHVNLLKCIFHFIMLVIETIRRLQRDHGSLK